MVNDCSNLSSLNNFITPNSKCYKIANDTNIDPITNRSPMSYFVKNMIEYCSKGKNILSSVCQNNYNNLKTLVRPKQKQAIQSNFSNQHQFQYEYEYEPQYIIYDNDIYYNNEDIYDYSDFILIILLIITLILVHFIMKKLRTRCKPKNNKYNYLFYDF